MLSKPTASIEYILNFTIWTRTNSYINRDDIYMYSTSLRIHSLFYKLLKELQIQLYHHKNDKIHYSCDLHRLIPRFILHLPPLKYYYMHVFFLRSHVLKISCCRDGGEWDRRTAYLSSDSLERQLRWTHVHNSVWPEIGWNWPVLPNSWQTLYLPLQFYLLDLIVLSCFILIYKLYECYNKAIWML